MILTMSTVVLALSTACSSGDDDSGSGATEGSSTTRDEEFEASDFGEPADASAADRTIDIIASDDLTFSPDSVDVRVGETVTFRVNNDGETDHDFTLGPDEVQIEHDQQMAEMGEMGHMASDPNAITVPSGETRDLTWHFTQKGTVLMGCHVPGHYAGGMKGEIHVGAA
jgi:uncharacterized cupredoxin-like copper-binding protein